MANILFAQYTLPHFRFATMGTPLDTRATTCRCIAFSRAHSGHSPKTGLLRHSFSDGGLRPSGALTGLYKKYFSAHIICIYQFHIFT